MEKLISGYEKDFLNEFFCKNKENLENRISKDFIEFGSSGKIYDRDTELSYLSGLMKNKEIDILDFKLSILSETILLANYRSFDKENNTYTLRTSIWKKEEDLWKICFHQGTPADFPIDSTVDFPAMEKHLVEFEKMEWIQGGTGLRYKKVIHGSQQVRLVEFSEGFTEEDWCLKGHSGIVLDGGFALDFNGRIEHFKKGDVCFIACGETDKHKAVLNKGEKATLLLFERNMLL